MRDKGIVFVVALLLVFSGWRFYQFGNLSDNTPANTIADELQEASLGETIEDTALVADQNSEQNAIESSAPFVVEQQTAGTVVRVTNMNLGGEYWLAVHANKEGTPGNVIGVRLFGAESTSGEIELPVSLKSGNTYHVVLHKDAGSRTWSSENEIVFDGAGKEVMVSFKAQ